MSTVYSDTFASFSSITRPSTAQSSRRGSTPAKNWARASVSNKIVVDDDETYDQLTGMIALTQISDSLSFVKTSHHLSLHVPTVILVTDTAYPTPDQFIPRGKTSSKKQPAQTTLLVQTLRDQWVDTQIVPLARKYWNDEVGKDFISRLIIDDESRPAMHVAMDGKYLALCASSALFKFLQTSMSLEFAPGSLKFEWKASEELVNNRASTKSPMSLFGVLNRTHTPMASRLLRSNILQPIQVVNILNKRLDAVEELISDRERFERVKKALKPMTNIDLDKLIAVVTRAERRVTQILTLRVAVRSLIAVCDAVKGCRSDLLSKIHMILSDDRLRAIEAVISDRLEDDFGVVERKRGSLSMRNAKIYAVKANHNRLLDVARETYKEVNCLHSYQKRFSTEHHSYSLCYFQNVHDILELVRGYQVAFQESGMTMSFDVDDVPSDGLPPIFKNVNKKNRNKFICTTLELKKRQQRYTDTLNEIFLLSDTIIQELVQQVLSNIADVYILFKIAMLDLFWSFSHVASALNYQRPEFTKTMAIKGGRHPILDKFTPSGPVVSNDVYASDTSNFQIIQGPNMSGKTTYICSIGLLTVQAMIGSYVSAEYASFTLNDALLARLSNDDDMSESLSTFAVEMRTTGGILSLATSKSLVLIDELGRGTSTVEGTAISHSIAEELIKSKACVFFSTHFRDLSLTLSGFPSVQKCLQGTSEEEHYGLNVAHLASLPADVLSVATGNIASRLGSMEQEGRAASRSNKVNIRRKAIFSIREKIRHAVSSELDVNEQADYLKFLQMEAVNELMGAK
ncbi:Mismatch repair ATPase MSH4 (MutS family) [Phaffia rhodozyma]|uniref:Mismatch repair ATPase MSH4 (MutS family) n=1 Tax=Phaffia rhodozyma TaxID=264483 RepID=A0A0F7SI63_PHARH|nr:Mismatch repair ATPase MSH4 (MutS family) [Phaffia rhodozyma]